MKNLRGVSLLSVAAAASMLAVTTEEQLRRGPVRPQFRAVPGARTLVRRAQARTLDGERRLFDRLQDGAAERIAAAQAKRDRKAARRATGADA